MKADQVLSAFRSFLKGDRDHAISVLRQIEAHERGAGRCTVADRLGNLIESRRGVLLELPRAPAEIRFYEPSKTLDSLMLSDGARDTMQSVIQEWEKREELSAFGLSPRSKMFFSGPSGNGKTALANALANAISLPLGIINYGEAIDSHMGETGKSISRAMEFAHNTPCVLFFDEADTLVSSRSASSSGAERESNRAVNQVLMELDAMPSSTLVIFATNMGDTIDTALSRRMDVRIELPAPVNGQREAFVRHVAGQWPFLDADQLAALSNSTGSYAECEELVRTAARNAVVSGIVTRAN